MKPNFFVAMLFLWVGSAAACFALAPGIPSTLMYFVRVDSSGAWCGYLSKDEWTRRSREPVATMMGFIDEKGGARQVNIRRQDSTADWVLDDVYSLDRSGRTVQLKRTVVYFSDDERKETVYEIHGSHPKIVKNAAFSLKTREPLHLPLPMDQFESWPVITRLDEFPFVELLKKIAAVKKAGAYCTGASQK